MLLKYVILKSPGFQSVACFALNFFKHHSQLKEFLKLFLVYEFGLCLAGLKILLCKVISVAHCNAISVDYYGIEFVKLKSKRPSAKQATD